MRHLPGTKQDEWKPLALPLFFPEYLFLGKGDGNKGPEYVWGTLQGGFRRDGDRVILCGHWNGTAQSDQIFLRPRAASDGTQEQYIFERRNPKPEVQPLPEVKRAPWSHCPGAEKTSSQPGSAVLGPASYQALSLSLQAQTEYLRMLNHAPLFVKTMLSLPLSRNASMAHLQEVSGSLFSRSGETRIVETCLGFGLERTLGLEPTTLGFGKPTLGVALLF